MGDENTDLHSKDPRDSFFAISQFYARQTQGIDEGDISAYSSTFGEKAIVVNSVNGSRLTGRQNIHTTALENFARRHEAGLQSRHLMYTRSTRQLANGLTGALSRVLILQTPRQGQTSILASVICDDLIARDAGGTLSIQFRSISPFG
ncbi:nuclear transport factor 2 family protein [Brachybacterium squillarum]|uniref:nuclear transport factor 2 family protein n=1 Tax=Brachybacterium squillarum TaxID=661979 RepID=UPI0002629645|nr:nuclear transport factor 2 family protein [Brachybacterium squillarum]